MIGLDAATLATAMAGCPMQRAQIWASFLDEAMHLADINSPTRAADFIAQIGHESLGLLYANEIWGPTEAQKTYERTSLNRGGRRCAVATATSRRGAGQLASR